MFHLACNQEEADTRVLFYAKEACNAPSNIVIRTDDTDCLIIAVECSELFEPENKLWLEVGK